MIDLLVKYRKDPNIISRRVADEMILVPLRRKAGEMDSIFTLNETAARAWELMDGTHSLAEIRDVLVQEFEVTAEEAGADLFELVEQLNDIGALIPTAGGND